ARRGFNSRWLRSQWLCWWRLRSQWLRSFCARSEQLAELVEALLDLVRRHLERRSDALRRLADGFGGRFVFHFERRELGLERLPLFARFGLAELDLERQLVALSLQLGDRLLETILVPFLGIHGLAPVRHRPLRAVQ